MSNPTNCKHPNPGVINDKKHLHNIPHWGIFNSTLERIAQLPRTKPKFVIMEMLDTMIQQSATH